MDKIEIYIDELLEKSTPDRPIWNIEKILQGLKSTWNYIDGCMIKAILEMYAITKDEKYFRFADNFIDCKVREDGSIEGYSVEELNIDNVNAGKTLFELYDLTGKEKYRKAIDLVYSQIEQMPRTGEEISGTRIFTRIRSGWTDCICVSRFIWSMRRDFMRRRTTTIFSASFSMWWNICVIRRPDCTIMPTILPERCSGATR